MAQNRPTILDDQPSTTDYLDFKPYKNTLCNLTNDPRTRTPLTIGIFGSWGTGKTTLLQMVMDELAKEDGNGKHNLVVWFNAWKYEREDALWRALLLRVVGAVQSMIPQDEKARKELTELEDLLYQAIEREEMGNFEFDWREFLKGAVETGAKIALATVPGLNLSINIIEELGKSAGTEGPSKLLQAIKRARTQVRLAQVNSIEQFENRFAEIIQRYVSPKGRLVVFIDDLDRCVPEKAIEVLEAIKLFLDAPDCIFILAVDRDVIARGIRIKYKDLAEEIEGSHYLEKIIQLPFELPPIVSEDVRSYVHALTPELRDPRCEEIFIIGLTEPNPRKIKRTINSFLFLSSLADARVERLGLLDDTRLAKIVVIQHSFPDLYVIFRHQPALLAELEAYFSSVEKRIGSHLQGPVSMPNLPEQLQTYAGREELRELLTLYNDDEKACFQNLRPHEIRPYFTLVQSISIERTDQSGKVIPKPQTVRIHKGDFTMGLSDMKINMLIESTDWAKEWKEKKLFRDEQPSHGVYLPDFEIGRYPVTNLEYQAFIKDTGYQSPPHWNALTIPEEIADHPVAYISFEDAMNYCDWLSKRTGKLYRLPNEAEWEKAARGEDERLYPWGDKFEPSLCNTAEGGLGATTPVGTYSPAGDSPYSCVDMAGNVWEWTFSKQKPYPFNDIDPKQSENYVLRGGSWGVERWSARVTTRLASDPKVRYAFYGFRVALDIN